MKFLDYYRAVAEAGPLNQGVGGGDPVEVALRQVKLILDLYPSGRPAPSAACDFGCGIGRTLPVLSVFWPGTRFVAIDSSPDFLEFCARQPGLSHVEFQLLETSVAHYSMYRSGSAQSLKRFDRKSAALNCDFTYSYSVLTHLNVPQAAEFFENLSATLRPGGMAFVSCFLLDADSRSAINDRRLGAGFSFPRKVQADADWFDANPDDPGAFSAFALDRLDDLAGRAGLFLRHVVRGAWRGAPDASLHDLILLEKLGSGLLRSGA